MSNYKKEAKHYRDVAQSVVNQHQDLRFALIEMEAQRDRAIEIAIDCFNGRVSTEEILALAELIKLSTQTSND